jgi:hypothetical protein
MARLDRHPLREAALDSQGITWERCPCCGQSAAVGWARIVEHPGAPSVHVDPVELDCLDGCQVAVDQLPRSLRR